MAEPGWSKLGQKQFGVLERPAIEGSLLVAELARKLDRPAEVTSTPAPRKSLITLGLVRQVVDLGIRTRQIRLVLQEFQLFALPLMHLPTVEPLHVLMAHPVTKHLLKQKCSE